MSDSIRLLNSSDQELGVALSLAQTAALTPEQRQAAAESTAGRALEERRVTVAEEGLELREDELTVARSLAESTRLTKTAEQNLKTETGLRKEVNTLLKDFFQVADANARVDAAGKNPSGAGDLALIFNFMKMLDPGSTVREGEFATAAQSAGIPQRVVGLYNRIIDGARLGNEQRVDFLDRAASLFDAALQEATKTANAFERIAIDNGVNVNNVLATFQERSGAPQATPIGRFIIEEVAP